MFVSATLGLQLWAQDSAVGVRPNDGNSEAKNRGGAWHTIDYFWTFGIVVRPNTTFVADWAVNVKGH